MHSLFLASCSYSILGTGYAKLVDHNCKPVKNKKIQVNNIESAAFLNSGHLTTDVYRTDQQGLFEFDIEKQANKLVIFIPDAKREKKSSWNWYWTVSTNDEVLYRFTQAHPNINFKTELLKSSVDQPIVMVYPHKKDTCNNSKALEIIIFRIFFTKIKTKNKSESA